LALMADLNDSLLVKATLKGDTGSFRVLVERYKNALFNLAYRLSQNRDVAEDMAQEAFVRAYENLRKFDQKRSFFTWLYTICTNLTINELKKREHCPQARDWEGQNERHEAIPLHRPSVGELAEGEERIEKRRERALIEGLLKKIPEEYRTAVILRYQEELSYLEIAEILSISLSLAKVRVHRGIEKLRTLLLETENG
jgi:RNA polymerase sigma-70 factor (ECF subfamily)